MKTIKIFTSALVMGLIAFSASAQVETVTTVGTNHFTQANGTADDLNNTGVIGVSNWPAFNDVAAGMILLDGANYHDTKIILRTMASGVSHLHTTRPEWMNTEEINEDIIDFQKDFRELSREENMSEEEYRSNLEEISEKYEDLREEALETFNKYVAIVQDANEEYKEEIEDGSLKNRKDAKEEYDEEIKDLKKIKDNK